MHQWKAFSQNYKQSKYFIPDPEKQMMDQVAVEVENYIQFYNNERIWTNLGMAPLEYRKLVG